MDEYEEYEGRKKIFQTYEAYLAQEVRPALAASDIKLTEEMEQQIAEEALEWHDDVDPDGNVRLNGSGYRAVLDEETFWEMVEAFRQELTETDSGDE